MESELWCTMKVAAVAAGGVDVIAVAVATDGVVNNAAAAARAVAEETGTDGSKSRRNGSGRQQ